MRTIRGKTKRRGGGRSPSLGSPGEETLELQLKDEGMKGWEREHKFHPTRRWKIDFVHKELMIAVEVEGGTWGGKGRHSRGAGFEKDCEKYFEAWMLGWDVIRVTTRMVMDERALEMIKKAIERKSYEDRSNDPD